MNLKSKRNSVIRKSVLEKGNYGVVIMCVFWAFLIFAYLLRILSMDWYTPTIGMCLFLLVNGIYLIKIFLKIRIVNKLNVDKKNLSPDEIKITDAAFELFNALDVKKIVLVKISETSQFVRIDEGVYIN